MLTRLSVVIMSQYIQIMNHCTIDLKLNISIPDFFKVKNNNKKYNSNCSPDKKKNFFW